MVGEIPNFQLVVPEKKIVLAHLTCLCFAGTRSVPRCTVYCTLFGFISATCESPSDKPPTKACEHFVPGCRRGPSKASGARKNAITITGQVTAHSKAGRSIGCMFILSTRDYPSLPHSPMRRQNPRLYALSITAFLLANSGSWAARSSFAIS